MKVICIADNGSYAPGVPKVYVGEEYTVMTVEVCKYDNKKRYTFYELGNDNLYLTSKFSPLSEIDETTFDRNYQKKQYDNNHLR